MADTTENTKTVTIRGERTRTLKTFYKKISKLLDFPSDFGKNLDALNDSLADLSWIPQENVVLIIEGKTDFLGAETEEIRQQVEEIMAEAAANPYFPDRSFRVELREGK